jgi:predicted nuclease of predicted toxin-antitoxin system
VNFLANENIPLDSVHLLRRAGHHVLSISEKHAGMKDVDVLKRAVKDKSIILTFDRDYGELIFKYPKLIPVGLVYFRFDPTTPEEPASILLKILKQKNIHLLKQFTIIEDDRIRQRTL